MKHYFAKYTRNFGNPYALRRADNSVDIAAREHSPSDLAPASDSRVLVCRPRRTRRQAPGVGA